MSGPESLPLHEKVWLGLRMWGWLAIIRIALWRAPLPRVVAFVCRPPSHPPTRRLAPRRLSGINHRTLRVGSHRPRCLLRALVHQRLLCAQGDAAELVIGLPERPADKDAHAWVELHGRAVGPPPGKGGHIELVRYPSTSLPVNGDARGDLPESRHRGGTVNSDGVAVRGHLLRSDDVVEWQQPPQA